MENALSVILIMLVVTVAMCFKNKFGIFLLCIFPVFVCIYWYQNEYLSLPLSNNISFGGNLTGITLNDANALYGLTTTLYESTKDKQMFQFNKLQTKSAPEVNDFALRLSERIIKEIGVLSSFPYHQVCLNNRNTLYVDRVLVESDKPDTGAISVNQKDGYNFYAQRGKSDCKDVFIEKFRNSSTTIEVGYFISLKKGHNVYGKDDPTFDLATTTVVTTNTTLTISLKPWVIIIGYLAVLFAWSFIFFQFEKIIEYIKRHS